jgi:hypothetical protein
VISIREKTIKIINPSVVISFDKDFRHTDDLIGIIFFEDKKHSFFEIKPVKTLTLDLYNEINFLKLVSFVVISIINYDGKEIFKTEILVDKSKQHYTYTRDLKKLL